MAARKHLSTAVVVLLTSVVVTTGCVRRMIDFTVISSKNVMLRRGADDPAMRVEGKDQVYWVLSIPLGVPNLKEAVDRAIESAGPEYDALIDGVAYSYGYWFVFGVSGFRVVGTPVVSSRLQVGMLNATPVLYHSRTGISNDAALAAIPLVHVDSKGQPVTQAVESPPATVGR